METINMHCKSISQIQLSAYSRLKVISLVEHTSELLNKQVYMQTEILKIIFWGSCKPTRKVCNENERKKKTMTVKIFLWWKEDFIRLHQKSGGKDFDEF